MDPHLLFCSDLACRNDAGDRLTRLEGWCVASSGLEAILAETGSEFTPLTTGFPRVDVRAAFPAYPLAERSGLRAFHEFESAAGAPVTLCCLVATAAGERAWHRVQVNLDQRGIQTIALSEATLITGATAELLYFQVSNSELMESRFRRSLETRRGLTLRLDIINKCNLRCVMCHFSDDAIFKRPTSQLNDEQFKALFEEIGPHVSQVILSCGDEPLTSKFLPEILRYLAEKHPTVAIEFCTNAMLMRAPLRDLFIETGVARLLFSMDAVTKPLLEKIRVGCRYEQLVGNIMALRDLRQQHGVTAPAFVFNFVMMNQNIHEAPAFVRVAKTLGAESVDFRHLVPIAPFFQPGEVLSEHAGKFNYFRERIVAEAAAHGLNYFLPDAFENAEPWQPEAEMPIDFRDFESVQPDAPTGRELTIKQPGFAPDTDSVATEYSTRFCNRPFSEIMIRDQEEVLPCPWHEKTLGRLSEGKTLSEIFFGEEFSALRRNMLKPEGDVGCQHCPIKTFHLPTKLNV